MTDLWSPVGLGRLTLPHRLAMSPMTRNRAAPDGSPTPLDAAYFAQRASLGLLIAGGTQPSADGQGFQLTHGCYTDAHIAGWRTVADPVHAAGGHLFVQLMHAGRVAHPDNTPHHRQPVAPSAIRADHAIHTAAGARPLPVPRALATEEVAATVADFRRAAAAAVAAGADGVEIHGANGFLVHQFLAENTNRRTDGYGGSVANRSRFAVEVATAVAEEIGADRTGIRLSPGSGSFGVLEGETGPATYRFLVTRLAELGLAYLHLRTESDETLLRDLRKSWPTALLVNRPDRPRDHTVVAHIAADLTAGLADLVPLGHLALANPDLVDRLRSGRPLNTPDRRTFYGGDHRGYTDYPATRRGNMLVDWDVPITMDDGIVLRADVFRPDDTEPHPVIMTHGPYAKGLAFQEGYPSMWANLVAEHPDALAGSSNRYQNWETVDPEKWVPDGYVVIRVDSRGAGRSPGYLDIFSPRETQDYYTCIEWAGVQPWSNGKVGLLGISYYGVNQWQVAALRPPHLAAICPWEGATDFYREFTHHGGILSVFVQQWYPVQVSSVQHGVAEDGPRSQVTGEPVAGPERLSELERAANVADTVAALRTHPLLDDYYRERSADLARITVPVLSATNWGHHLHTRGGFEGYGQVSSEQKWLEVHGLQHWVEFYSDYGLDLQKRFFGHFLQGADTGWTEQPPVQLNLRRVDGGFERRAETEWPLARTEWTKFHLDLAGGTLSGQADRSERGVEFDALGAGLEFWTEPLVEPMELTGPGAATLRVASSTSDADVFLTLRVRDPDGLDVTFPSAMDPRGGIGFGWLRSSLRKPDPERSTPYRPWHSYDERQPLTPGEPVDLRVEFWPTSVLIPAGYRLGVSVQGRDFEFPGAGPWPSAYGISMRGNGIFVHTDPSDRGGAEFAGRTTLISGGEHPSFLLLPVIPAGK